MFFSRYEFQQFGGKLVDGDTELELNNFSNSNIFRNKAVKSARSFILWKHHYYLFTDEKNLSYFLENQVRKLKYKSFFNTAVTKYTVILQQSLWLSKGVNYLTKLFTVFPLLRDLRLLP